MALTAEELDRLAIDTIRTLAIDAVPEGELRASRRADGHGADGLRALDAVPAPRAHAPGLAGSRPVRPVGGPREHAPLLAPPPDRLRRLDGRPQVVPPVGLAHARPPGVRPDARRRGDHRPARPGLRERASGWPSPSGASRPSSTGRATHDRRPPDLRDRAPTATSRRGSRPRRRRWPATCGSGSSSSCTTTTTSSSTARPTMAWSRGRPGALRRLRLAHPARRRTATTSRRSRPRSTRRDADPRPSLIAVRTHIGFGSPEQAGLARRRTARRSGRTRSA